MEQSAKSADEDAALINEGNKWMERIRAAGKRENSWMKDAEAAEKAYASNEEIGVEGKVYDFNILHSNVETIVPAIYNSTPVPDVRSRNTLPSVEEPKPPQAQQGMQPDPRAVTAFQQQMAQYQAIKRQEKLVKDFGAMIERGIAVQIDDNKLDAEIESEAQDAFLSGRGIIRVRFHADISERQEEADEIAEMAAGDDENGGEAETYEVPPIVTGERITFEAVSWRDFRRGPAKRWEDLPWMAFRHSMSREEVERITDKELIARQAIDGVEEGKEEDEDGLVVWEVWCKDSRTVKFIRDSDGKIIKKDDDPLGLTGFFPIPNPVQPIALTGRLTPVCPFSVYKKLADELDLCTKRINKIMSGLKVRGLIAGDASDIEALALLDDNQLGTVRGSLENLAQTKGIDGAVLWWPVEQAVKVLKELYLQREQIKQSIYELTGISDIVRGASNAGETATAQQIKTQWGSLRIQKMQRLIQRQVRDLFIMCAEILTTKFSPETLQRMTGIQITPEMQQLMNERVMAYYRIDVESDSTVKADTTRIRGEMTEFMGGTGQYFGTMAPLVGENPQLAAPVAEIYRAFSNNFNLGKQAEDALDELVEMAKQSSKKPKPNPEQEKLKVEMELKKAELQMDGQRLQAEIQAKQQEAQIKAQSDAAKVQTDRERAQIDLQKAMVDLQIKRLELEMKAREMSMGLQAKQAETGMKLDAQRQSNEMKAEQQRRAAKAKAVKAA